MGDFEFPSNIKQIGSIGDGLRIYMEDYVCTYLQQYTEAAGYEERIALLIGRDMIIDSQKVLFISGTVQGRHTKMEEGILLLTDKTWEYAREQIDLHFKGQEVVGWMQSQPGYGTVLSDGYAQQHMRSFKMPWQVLYVMDPLEKLNTFYIWEGEPRALKEASGYFIYYDKNRGMHDYMLNNKVVTMKLATQNYMPDLDEELEEEEEITEKEKKPLELPEMERTRARSRDLRRRRNPVEQKKVMNMLVSLSAVLFIVCFIMGAGLIQNDGRIHTLEEQLTLLNASYNAVIDQVRLEAAESAFAPSDAAVDPTQAAQEDSSLETTPVLIREDGGSILEELAAADEEELITIVVPEPSAAPEVQASPAPQETEAPEPQNEQASARNVPETYTVQQGDSLIGISRQFYGSDSMVDRIMELNNLDNADKIFYGKILQLP